MACLRFPSAVCEDEIKIHVIRVVYMKLGFFEEIYCKLRNYPEV